MKQGPGKQDTTIIKISHKDNRCYVTTKDDYRTVVRKGTCSIVMLNVYTTYLR